MRKPPSWFFFQFNSEKLRINGSPLNYVVKEEPMISIIAITVATILLAPATLFAAGFHKAR